MRPRAGSTTKFSWGNDIGWNRANCNGCGSQWDQEKTAPVGSFPANVFGLYDMHGNVYESTEDCSGENYAAAPSDESAWKSGDCSIRIIRGGSWKSTPRDLRSANRDGATASSLGRGSNWRGFRVVRTIAH